MAQDLRELLFLLYLRNNPQLKHQVFIYTYQGVGGMAINPFQYVCADLEPNVRKSLILQNLPAGEMLQAFIVPQDENHPDAAYEIENTVLVDWDESFYPCYTPKEMLELGVFEGKYLNDDKDEYPSSWFKNAKMSTTADESLNKYKIKSRQSLQVWKANGWINKQDPKGWFQWYCRYYNGRRSSDDKRQINRWRSFVSRHMGQIKANCKLDDDDCRPKQRQGLLQWAWDSSKKFDDPSVIENNLKKMKASASVVKEDTFFQATEYDSLSEMVLSEGYLNSIRHIRDYLDIYIVEVDCTKMSMSEIESLTEDTRLSGYKPVYIVLTDTGSLMIW